MLDSNSSKHTDFLNPDLHSTWLVAKSDDLTIGNFVIYNIYSCQRMPLKKVLWIVTICSIDFYIPSVTWPLQIIKYTPPEHADMDDLKTSLEQAQKLCRAVSGQWTCLLVYMCVLCYVCVFVVCCVYVCMLCVCVCACVCACVSMYPLMWWHKLNEPNIASSHCTGQWRGEVSGEHRTPWMDPITCADDRTHRDIDFQLTDQPHGLQEDSALGACL